MRRRPEDPLERGHESVQAALAIVSRVERDRDVSGRAFRIAQKRAESWQDDSSAERALSDNDLSHADDIATMTDVDRYLTAALERQRVLDGIAVGPIAPLLLASADPDARCKVRHLPQSWVTFDRCLAHVLTLELPISNENVESCSRLLMLALLNCRPNRVEARPPQAKATTAKAPEPTQASASPTELVPVQEAEFDDQSLAPPGRVVIGYVETIRSNYFMEDGMSVSLAKGKRLVQLAPSSSEASESECVSVWWRKKVRRLKASDVTQVSREQFLAQRSGKVEDND